MKYFKMQERSIRKQGKKERVKVIFVIPSLGAGGAERVFAFVSQHLNPDKFSTELLVMGKSEQTIYSVDKIPVIYLGKNRVLHAIPSLFQFLRNKKPHIVLSSVGHLNMVAGIMATLCPSIRFIIRPTSIESKETGGWLAKKCFSQVHSVICQSEDMANNFEKLYEISTEKITVIGNPVTTIEDINTTEDINQTRKFITVGRLNQIKGHSRILKVLAQLNKNFHYTIIGDGPERDNLLAQIDDLQLNAKITHIHYTDKVNDYLVQSDLFLQGSYSEGFPNAVLESCAMGTPALAFDVPGGTKEIIEHGTNGFLVANEEEYLAILTADHHWKRSDIRHSVLSKFDPEIVLDKYERLLVSTL